MSLKWEEMKVFVVHWHKEELQERLDALAAEGLDLKGHWNIEDDVHLRASLPDVLILTLDRLPSHSRAIADWLWEGKSRRHIPIIFAGGSADKVESAQIRFPEAWFREWDEIPELLAKLVANLP